MLGLVYVYYMIIYVLHKICYTYQQIYCKSAHITYIFGDIVFSHYAWLMMSTYEINGMNTEICKFKIFRIRIIYRSSVAFLYILYSCPRVYYLGLCKIMSGFKKWYTSRKCILAAAIANLHCNKKLTNIQINYPINHI